jgi:hypothetical protein
MRLRTCTIVAAVLALCTLLAPFRATAQAQVDRIFVQCVVMQGNGYNWAATLGWLSGQVELAVTRAGAWEARNPGLRAGIDLRCATGSSSGAPVAAVLDALLANPSLTTPGDPWQTVEEARDVARALMFLALSTNFDGEYRRLIASGVGAWLGLLDRGSNALNGRYWRGVSTAAVNSRIFGIWVRAARAYQPDWPETVGMEALPFSPVRPRDAGQSGLDPAARRMERTAGRARAIVDGALEEAAPLAGPIGYGICSTALTVAAGPRPPFDYDDLRLIAICNPATVGALDTNRHLLRWLAASDQVAFRLALATASDWPALLNVTLREPELMTPLSGRLAMKPIDLGAIRTPSGSDGRAVTGPVVVMGGFADPRQQAWISSALLADRLDALRASGIAAEGRVAVFGRTENRSDPTETFAQRTMTTYFTGKDPAADPVLPRYYDWQDEYCAVAADLAPGVAIDFYRMDWNLPHGPAAISGRSQVLAAKGYNLGKVQTPRTRYPDLPPQFWRTYMFDPVDSALYIPDPPAGGMTCLPIPE